MTISLQADHPALQDFFLARQPILNRDQRLVAYELLFRSTADNQASITGDAVAATATVIAHATDLGMEQAVGLQLAFINVDAVALMSDFIGFLPHQRVVLEILETVRPTPALLARIGELRQAGFRFALDDVVLDTPDVQQLLPLVDVIKVDIAQLTPVQLQRLAQVLAVSRKKLLAEKVETVAQFEQCLALGFDFFQGYYFARPVILSGKRMSASELAILHLLELIQGNADNRELERCIKHDAMLALNLLRLVNTPAVSAGVRVDTLGQALLLLGRRQLQRWLQILLYVRPGTSAQFTSPLLQLATTRGKLLELMTLRVRPGDTASADRAFTVGIMSLAEALFSVRMADILVHVEVAHDVRDALIDRDGDFGTMLRIAELLETAVGGRKLNTELKKIGLTVPEVREIELAAFDWVRELTHDVR